MSSIVDLGIARINTTIAKETKQVDEGIQTLMSNSSNRKRLIGLDTLRVRTGTRGTSLALLQLCVGSQCLVIRLTYFYGELPESLYNFLSLPGFTFVGFGIKNATASLWKEFGIVCKNFVEVGLSESHKSPSHSRAVCNMYIPPSCCISDNWCAHENLAEDIIKLAVSNAHAAFRIGERNIVSYYC